MGASPSVPQKSVHEFTVKDCKNRDVDLSIYKGKVLLVVNVASKCGFTNSNYRELTELYNRYKGKDFEILAFPCNQFLYQEPGSGEDAHQFACERFKAEYPVFEKDMEQNARRGHPRILVTETVEAQHVKLGEEYELVVTNAGLYRYRVGDLLRVAGFKNKAPQFNFICRKNVVLSIDSDKTDEVELQNAIKNAMNHLMAFDTTLLKYTSYADTTTIPGHYVLF